MEPPQIAVTNNYLQGPTVEIPEDYGGLGAHFLDKLFENLNKIHQVLNFSVRCTFSFRISSVKTFS